MSSHCMMFGVVGMDLLRNEAIFHGGFHNGRGIPYKRISYGEFAEKLAEAN